MILGSLLASILITWHSYLKHDNLIKVSGDFLSGSFDSSKPHRLNQGHMRDVFFPIFATYCSKLTVLKGIEFYKVFLEQFQVSDQCNMQGSIMVLYVLTFVLSV